MSISNELIEHLQSFFQINPHLIEIEESFLGYSNKKKYIAQVNEQKYFIKQFLQNEQYYKEVAINQELQHFAPKIITSNENWVVYEYLPHRNLSYHDYTYHLDEILSMVKKLHQIETPYTYQTRDSLRQCEKLISEHVTFPSELINLYERYNQEPILIKQSCFIHNDLNYSNMLIDKERKIYLVDWDDCGFGDPYEDLAELSIFFPVSRHQDILLNYHGEISQGQLEHFSRVYRKRILWFAIWSYYQAYKRNEQLKEKDWFEVRSCPEKSFEQYIGSIVKGFYQIETSEDFLKFSVACYEHVINAL